ncbi:MAG: sigma-54-dependent Fis family transcriptional regulator [Deltaproteobacteria bacterium]|nr:sigma-54-dependent Fis family transcriptional regulator [Deltaproteobacteria bacterium]
MTGTKSQVLVVDDEPGLRETIAIALRRAGFDVVSAPGTRQAKSALAQARFDVVVTDLVMPDGSGIDVLNAAREHDPTTQVVVITAYATTDQAVRAMRAGAYDFVQKPFSNEELRATVDKAIEKRRLLDENQELRARIAARMQLGDIVGKSEAMQSVMNLVRRVAPSKTSVLITGESGTGKELVARALHAESGRATGPFVAINCGALPEALMESELFGYEKGAFTGAQQKKSGLFHAASGGTLFLDEVSELPLPLQVKLLRVLQERRVRPVGGTTETEVDVRIVSATNRDLDRDVAEGRMRSDLFYRLNVVRIELPPLRDRPGDVELLAQHFRARFAGEQRKVVVGFSPEAMRALLRHPFPGNVRELENVIERAVTLAASEMVELEDLPTEVVEAPAAKVQPLPLDTDAIPPAFELEAHLAALERGYLEAALAKTGGGKKAAAQLLGLTFRSFRYRLAKYGMTTGDDEP